MKISSTQKVIRVGSSLAVTIPAKEAKRLGIEAGSEVKSTISTFETAKGLPISSQYEQFKQQYAQTLKNLADR